MTTVAAAIAQIRRDLRRSYKGIISTLSAAISSTTATTFNLNVAADTLSKGTVVQIDDELIFILATSSTTAVTNCIRGYDGTTAATHLINAIVEVDPRFVNADIRNAIGEEIQSWEPDLFAVGTVTQTITSASTYRAWEWTDTTGFLHLLGANVQPSSTIGTLDARRPIEIIHHAIESGQDTSTFASGWAYIIKQSNVPDGTVTVEYAKHFTTSTVSDATDLQSTVGIPASCNDVLRYGVMWRLMAVQEAQRSDRGAQDEARVAREVTEGRQIAAADYYRALRDRRLAEETLKLHARYQLVGW